MSTKVNPIPEGFHTITPFLIVPNAAQFMDYMKQAFNATEDYRMEHDGKVTHASMKIGNSIFMLSEASERFPAFPGMFYLYVEDCDALYKQALAVGGTSLREPTTEFYGDRSCGIADDYGNQWWIATHVEDVSEEEMERRQQEMAKQ